MVDPFIAGKFANTGSSPPVLMEGTISFGSIWPTYDNTHKIVFLMGQVDLPTAFEWYKSGLRVDCVWSTHTFLESSWFLVSENAYIGPLLVPKEPSLLEIPAKTPEFGRQYKILQL